MTNLKKIIESTILCIRYPFLFPRDRYNGLHYNNYKILKYTNNLKHKYRCFNDINDRDLNTNERKYFVKESYLFVEYWKNPFIKIWVDIVTFYHNNILQIFHCIPEYTEWDYIPEGWRKSFGDEYLKELRKQLKKDKLLYKFRILDLKEKCGTLRLYPSNASWRVIDIIDKYEDLSYNTCIKCGNQPANFLSKCYILPYCDNCVINDEINKYEPKESLE